MQVPAAVLLALALSLDSLAVGLVYGGRGIRLPGTGLALTGAISATALGVAMLLGGVAGGIMGAAWSRRLGAGLLMAVGLYVLWQARRSSAGQGREQEERRRAGSVLYFSWRFRTLRLVVTILREPGAADLDRSGSINAGEALLLGTALAADSFAAGIGAGMAGFSPTLLPLLAGGATWLSLYAGSRLASRLPWQGSARWEWLHGLVLFALGLTRLW